MDPRFRFFYDLVRIVNFFQREQASPIVYLLENTFPGERCTLAVQKANDLVQSFLGAPVLIDAADLGAAAHRGGARICMPTVVSYLRSNAFRPKDNGNPGEGEVFNTQSLEWVEPDTEEKEQLLGYAAGDTAAPGVTDAERAIRLGRALEGNTMRWLGAFLHASYA